MFDAVRREIPGLTPGSHVRLRGTVSGDQARLCPRVSREALVGVGTLFAVSWQGYVG